MVLFVGTRQLDYFSRPLSLSPREEGFDYKGPQFLLTKINISPYKDKGLGKDLSPSLETTSLTRIWSWFRITERLRDESACYPLRYIELEEILRRASSGPSDQRLPFQEAYRPFLGRYRHNRDVTNVNSKSCQGHTINLEGHKHLE